MQNLFILSILLFSLTLVGCSKKNSADDEGNAGVELTEADEFLEDDSEDAIDDDSEEEMAESDGEESDEDFADEESDEVASNGDMQDSTSEVQVSDNIGTYTVKKNETLMLISFKIYGDYSKWRDLAQLNSGVNPNALSACQTIQYYTPTNEFVWNPEGNPYLIKREIHLVQYPQTPMVLTSTGKIFGAIISH